MNISITATAKNGKVLNIIGTSNAKGNFDYTIDGVDVDIKFNLDNKKNCVFFPAEITKKYFGVNQPASVVVDYKTSFKELLQNKVCAQLVGQIATIKKLTLATAYGDVLTIGGVEVSGEMKDAILEGGIKKIGSYVITEKGLGQEANIVFETETDDNNLIFGKGNW